MDAYDAAKWLSDIDVALMEGFEPNEWERDFIDSIRQWIEDGKSLSDKQTSCLEKVRDKALEGEKYR